MEGVKVTNDDEISVGSCWVFDAEESKKRSPENIWFWYATVSLKINLLFFCYTFNLNQLTFEWILGCCNEEMLGGNYFWQHCFLQLLLTPFFFLLNDVSFYRERMIKLVGKVSAFELLYLTVLLLFECKFVWLFWCIFGIVYVVFWSIGAVA